MDSAAVDLDRLEPHEPCERLETTRDRKGLPHISPEWLVAIEVGEMMPSSPHSSGLTRERIRQIEIRALAKLRHSRRRHYLEDFC